MLVNALMLFAGYGEPEQRIAAQHVVLDRPERAKIAALHGGKDQIPDVRPNLMGARGVDAEESHGARIASGSAPIACSTAIAVGSSA